MKSVMVRGFTLIEMILVMSIFMLLVSMSVPSLIGTRTRADLGTTVSTVVGDIKSQQHKAMVSDTEGRAEGSSYGVHFEAQSYTLFHGDAYDPDEPSNATITLDNSLEFTDVDFPDASLIFVKRSGELSGFVTGIDSFSLRDKNSSLIRTVIFNRFGVVTQIE